MITFIIKVQEYCLTLKFKENIQGNYLRIMIKDQV
jgi:hypothetical protein